MSEVVNNSPVFRIGWWAVLVATVMNSLFFYALFSAANRPEGSIIGSPILNVGMIGGSVALLAVVLGFVALGEGLKGKAVGLIICAIVVPFLGSLLGLLPRVIEAYAA